MWGTSCIDDVTIILPERAKTRAHVASTAACMGKRCTSIDARVNKRRASIPVVTSADVEDDHVDEDYDQPSSSSTKCTKREAT